MDMFRFIIQTNTLTYYLLSETNLENMSALLPLINNLSSEGPAEEVYKDMVTIEPVIWAPITPIVPDSE